MQSCLLIQLWLEWKRKRFDGLRAWAGLDGRARAGLEGRAGRLVKPRASASRKDNEEHFFVCSTLLSKPKIMNKLFKKLFSFMKKLIS